MTLTKRFLRYRLRLAAIHDKPILSFGFFALAGLLLISALFAQTPGPHWFVTQNGDVSCRANTAQLSPFKFFYVCSNPRGATSGSYTADPVNLATDLVTVGLTGMNNSGSSICGFGVNMTAAAVNMGGIGIVPPLSVAFQCASQSLSSGTVPANTVTPAATIMPIPH